MNTLKKTVAVVLAIAMVLSMGVATSFAAFSDVPSTVSYATAVNILSNLGIINGYEDGTFRPDNTITRAEVATIIVNALALPETNGPTVFSDVPADHWAAGYINTAQAAGIIAGMGDGTFAPGADVTYEQVVKMVVSALNYGDYAMNNGGYPQGFMAIASRNGITTGAAGITGQPATRAAVARMIYNALEVPMLDISQYGTGLNGNYYAPNANLTLLSNLGVEKLEVIVSKTYLTDGDYSANDRTIDLIAARKYREDSDSRSLYVADGVDRGDVIGNGFDEGGTAAASLLGYSCVAYVGEDAETGVDTIYAISAKGNNSVTVVNSDKFASDEASATTKKGRVYFWKNTSDSKASSVALSDDVKVFTNYSDDNDANLGSSNADSEVLTQAYEEYFTDAAGTVQFIDNNGDGEVDFVLANKYTSESVIEEVEENYGIWSFSVYSDTDDLEDYDPEDEDVLKQFVKNETYINVNEIQPGDTITAISNDNGSVVLYYVSSETVQGTSSNYDRFDQTVVINNKTYGVSPIHFDSAQSVAQKEGVFYINVDGLISHYEASSSLAGDTVFVTWVGNEKTYSASKYQMQFVDANGKEQVLQFASTVYLYDGTNENGSNRTQYKSSNVADLVTELEGILTSAPENRVMRISVSGGKISRVYTNNDEDFNATTINSNRYYDAEDMSIGGITFDNSTVVFALTIDDTSDNSDTSEYTDPANVSVSTASAILVDDSNYTGWVYGDTDGALAALLVNPSSPINKSNNVFVVSDVRSTLIDDEDALVVSGRQKGQNKTITIFDPNDTSLIDAVVDDNGDLVKGTVLLLGEESGGYVKDVDVLVRVSIDDSEDGRARITENSISFVGLNEDSDRGNGIVQDLVEIDVDATSSLKNNGVVFTNYTPSEADGGYRVANGTTVTLVNCDNTRIANVSVGSGSASSLRLKNTSTYDYVGKVFFRAYDVTTTNFDLQDSRGDVVDIVLYRFRYAAGSTNNGGNNGNNGDNGDEGEEIVGGEEEEEIGVDLEVSNDSSAEDEVIFDF